MAYDYPQEKDFLKDAQSVSAAILEDLQASVREEGIPCQFFLVGSGGRNMITRNGDGPIDFDYNLNILSFDDWKGKGAGKRLKDTIHALLNDVLRAWHLSGAEDSTSSLTIKLMYLSDYGEELKFSIDIAIVVRDQQGSYHRLIHEKHGNSHVDRWLWNKIPDSRDVAERAKLIKQKGKWQAVRTRYLEKKNHYFSKGDNNHSSFICYIESVNEVYFSLKQKGVLLD